MELIDLIALLLTLTASFAYINYRWLRFPMAIGVMVVAIVFSLLFIAASYLNIWHGQATATKILSQIDFSEALLNGMLSLLLFAGALHINLENLAEQKWMVFLLATFGTFITTFIVGGVVYEVSILLNYQIPLIYCLLFGALIAPTDPIAVLATLKTAGVPKSLETKIAGESLFNDGIGVVIFMVLVGIAAHPEAPNASDVLILLAEEVVGGVVMGFIAGFLTFWLLRSINNYQVELLITLAAVLGSYNLAMNLHFSGPISVVIMGLFIGNHGRMLAMSEMTRQRLFDFWDLIDEILNAILFVLIGLEILIVQFSPQGALLGLLAIVIVLCARVIAVAIPIKLASHKHTFPPKTIPILVWGGIKGGISVALALSLPQGPYRDLLLQMTYIVVLFSILVQGMTIGPLARQARIDGDFDEEEY